MYLAKGGGRRHWQRRSTSCSDILAPCRYVTSTKQGARAAELILAAHQPFVTRSEAAETGTRTKSLEVWSGSGLALQVQGKREYTCVKDREMCWQFILNQPATQWGRCRRLLPISQRRNRTAQMFATALFVDLGRCWQIRSPAKEAFVQHFAGSKNQAGAAHAIYGGTSTMTSTTVITTSGH